MRINTTDEICGLPILSIRDLLRRTRDNSQWTLPSIQSVLNISEARTRAAISELVSRGLLERIKHGRQVYWANTIAGNALAMASAAKPMTRAAAEELLRKFLERVKEVNESSEYVFQVPVAFVFGSYLSSAELLNDLDLAVCISPKCEDLESHNAARERQIEQAESEGKRFRNMLDEQGWPEQKVIQHLKLRSSRISHSLDQLALLETKYSQVYPAGA